MSVTLTWIPRTGPGAQGHCAYLGTWNTPVFITCRDPYRGGPWTLLIDLPADMRSLNDFTSEEEAQACAEEMLARFIKAIYTPPDNRP